MVASWKKHLSTINQIRSGVIRGLAFGLIPHLFCILFIIFSIIGATIATTFTQKILLMPNLFPALVIISIVFATIASIFHLRIGECKCDEEVKGRKRFVLAMFVATLIANVTMMYVIFPAIAKTRNNNITIESSLSVITVKVAIPCTGHAPLIINEIGTLPGIVRVDFDSPDIFQITYDPQTANIDQIVALNVFETFQIAKIIKT